MILVAVLLALSQAFIIEKRFLDRCPFKGCGEAGSFRSQTPNNVLYGKILKQEDFKEGDKTVIYNVQVIRMEGEPGTCSYKDNEKSGTLKLHSEVKTSEDMEVCKERLELREGNKIILRGDCRKGIFYGSPCHGISIVSIFTRLDDPKLVMNTEAKKEAEFVPTFIKKMEVAKVYKSRETEQDWFDKQTIVTDLEPGDIILEKSYDDSNKVVASQKAAKYKRTYYLGSEYSEHAILVVKGGSAPVLMHSNAFSPSGVKEQSLKDYKAKIGPSFKGLVFRTRNKEAIKSAVETAKYLLGLNEGYSLANCFYSGLRGVMQSYFPLHYARFGFQAQKRAKKVASRTMEKKKFMCSEFVSYAFQGSEPPYLMMDSKRVSPIQLEMYLRTHQEWQAVGRIVNNEVQPRVQN